MSSTPEPPPLDTLDTEELRLLASRERERLGKQERRARSATERATAALAPNPSAYVVPPTPAGLSRIRKWVRQQHDAYSRRDIGVVELTEVRRTASNLGDLYKAGAEMRKAEAALRAAAAQERLGDILAALEHGGATVALLAQLRASDGLVAGPRRPLPRAVTPLPRVAPAEEGA